MKGNKKSKNMDCIPPDFDFAETHSRSCLMRDVERDKNLNNEICQCCGRRSDAQPYDLMVSPDEFAIHGFGITLYFYLFKYGIFLCGAMGITASLVFLLYCNGGISSNNLINLNEDILNKERIAGSDYSKSIVNSLTLGRVLRKEQPIVIALSAILFMIIFYFLWTQLCGHLIGKEAMLDQENLTPVDYSVKLAGIPPSLGSDQVTEAFNLQLKIILAADSDLNVTIEKIVYAYDLTAFEKKVNDLVALSKRVNVIQTYREQKIKSLEAQGKVIPSAEIEHLLPASEKHSDLKKITQEIDSIKEDLYKLDENGNPVIGATRLDLAYVTFSYPIAEKVLEKFEVSPIEYFCSKSKFFLGDTPVMVRKAPEPEEIMWANLGISYRERVWRTIGVWAATLALLCLTLIASILVSLKGKDIKENGDDSNLSLGLSAGCSVIVVIMHQILLFAIPNFTLLEKSNTKTDYDLSLAFKLSLALFANCGLIPTLTHYKAIYFTNGGFTWVISLNWLLLCFLNPILQIFNPGYLFLLIKQKFILWKGEKSTLTQEEANIELEPPKAMMATRYANIITIFFYTCFFIIFFPPGIIFSILGLALNYWVEKWLILRRLKVAKIDGKIAIYSFQFIGYMGLGLMFISSIIFLVKLKEDSSSNFSESIICLAVFLAVLLSLRLIVKVTVSKESWIFRILVENIQHKFINKFETQKFDITMFGTKSYEFANPITRVDAINSLKKPKTMKIPMFVARRIQAFVAEKTCEAVPPRDEISIAIPDKSISHRSFVLHNPSELVGMPEAEVSKKLEHPIVPQEDPPEIFLLPEKLEKSEILSQDKSQILSDKERSPEELKQSGNSDYLRPEIISNHQEPKLMHDDPVQNNPKHPQNNSEEYSCIYETVTIPAPYRIAPPTPAEALFNCLMGLEESSDQEESPPEEREQLDSENRLLESKNLELKMEKIEPIELKMEKIEPIEPKMEKIEPIEPKIYDNLPIAPIPKREQHYPIATITSNKRETELDQRYSIPVSEVDPNEIIIEQRNSIPSEEEVPTRINNYRREPLHEITPTLIPKVQYISKHSVVDLRHSPCVQLQEVFSKPPEVSKCEFLFQTLDMVNIFNGNIEIISSNSHFHKSIESAELRKKEGKIPNKGNILEPKMLSDDDASLNSSSEKSN